jgi:hypothetical protein
VIHIWTAGNLSHGALATGLDNMLCILTLNTKFWMAAMMSNHKNSDQVFFDDAV